MTSHNEPTQTVEADMWQFPSENEGGSNKGTVGNEKAAEDDDKKADEN